MDASRTLRKLKRNSVLHVKQGLNVVNIVNGTCRTTQWTTSRCLLQGEISSSLEVTDGTNLIPVDNRGSLDTSTTYRLYRTPNSGVRISSATTNQKIVHLINLGVLSYCVMISYPTTVTLQNIPRNRILLYQVFQADNYNPVAAFYF